MLKSKASRTTNEAVREAFSIKRCQSSITFKEGESAQRVLALVAVVAAGIATVVTADVSTGGGRGLANFFPALFLAEGAALVLHVPSGTGLLHCFRYGRRQTGFRHRV